MDIFRIVLGGGGQSSADSNKTTSSAETIERLVERLNSATLLDDRRDACRALKAMSRKFRVEVGAQAVDSLMGVLENDRHDEEIVGYSLETVANVCNPELFDEEEEEQSPPSSGGGGVGQQFTEIILKRQENVQLVIDVLQDYDFRIRRPAIRLLTFLLTNKPREMQDVILSSRMAVSRLMDVLVDSREVLRNDALILLILVTKGNANLQKIVAFENAFDKLVDIVELEGHSDGGIVVEDCLRLMLNLLRNNSSNQVFFREGSYVQRMSNFFQLNLSPEETEVGWSAQKVSNVLHMLQTVRTLVSPSNSTQITAACQTTIRQCGLLARLCDILMTSGIPADVLTETVNALSETIRGHGENQTTFMQVVAPSVPPRPILVLLLMSMVNEKQPFALRCSALYCFQSYLHKNPVGQAETMQPLLIQAPEDKEEEEEEVTAGQLICMGMFSKDPLSNWFSAVALAHGLAGLDEVKKDLLRIQLSAAADDPPVSLMRKCFSSLANGSPSIPTRLGILMLLCTWVSDCPSAVADLLSVPDVVPFLTGQVGSNEHDETEKLVHGLCAFLLGLCLVSNDDSVAGCTKEQLLQLVEKRIGTETFIDKLGEVSKHEGYSKAMKQPQLKCADVSELIFDSMFCRMFKTQEHAVTSELNASTKSESAAQPDPMIVTQYKDLIREQDQRINDISRANIYLQQELKVAKQELEESRLQIQSLQDQNKLLKVLQGGGDRLSNGDEPLVGSSTSQIELDNVQKQLSAVQVELSRKVEELERQAKWKNVHDSLKEEHDDLLMMLADQDAKTKSYRKLLTELGHAFSVSDSGDSEQADEDDSGGGGGGP